MRLLAFGSAALLAVGLLMVACDTVDPGECWVNTSGGFGGSGTIPIGAGVGVSSGDFISPPRYHPLGNPAPANPCVSMGGDTAQPGGNSAAASGAGGSGGAPPLPLCNADGGEVSDGSGGATSAAGGGAANPCIMPPQNPCFEQCNTNYDDAAAVCGMIPDAAQRTACDNNAYANYKTCRSNCAVSANNTCDDNYQNCDAKGPSSCLKKVAGQSQCQRCWERCNAGDSPSSTCKKCLF